MTDNLDTKQKSVQLSTSLTNTSVLPSAAKWSNFPVADSEPRLSVETLVEVTQALTSQSSLAVVLKEILRQAQRLAPYQTGHIVLVEEDKLRSAAWHGYQAFGSEVLMSKLVQPLTDFPLDSQVIQTRQPLLIFDTHQEPLWTVQDETRWVRSNLMLPICLGSQVLGLLRLDADTPGAFSADNIISLQPLANIAAIALENARLFDQARQEISERQRVEEALQRSLREAELAYRQAMVYAQELNEEINERKRSDQERRQLSAAIEQTAESIIITDIEGIICYVNPAFERITGYSREEIIQKTPRLLKSNHQSANFYKELWTTIQSGQVWQGRIVNKKKDGSLYTSDTTISPVRDKTGVIVNYVAAGRDITQELKMEEQYRQAQKMEAVGRLAGGVAHDFNNLLTAISGFAEMTQAQLPPDHPSQEFIEIILDSSGRATELIRQLLAFSRQQVITPKVLSLNTVVANLNKMLTRLIGEDIDLKTNLASDLEAVKVDPTQIEQVIVNLVVNALDAMPSGGQLTIETSNIDLDENYVADRLDAQPGEYVLLTVSDSGIGMTEEVKAHIFEPFFTTKEPGKGTGLGLATVFGIVKQNAGHIGVYSEPGHGAAFRIYLPRVKIAAPPSAERPARLTNNLPQGKETVLLVEDEPKVRDLADRLLRRQGYTVLTATNGEEALHVGQAYEGEIHLLLTDMVMPQMNGKDLADRFKILRPDMKVIYTSGYTDKAIVHQGILDADIAFIQKPFTVMDLAQKVRAVLDKKDR